MLRLGSVVGKNDGRVVRVRVGQHAADFRDGDDRQEADEEKIKQEEDAESAREGEDVDLGGIEHAP